MPGGRIYFGSGLPPVNRWTNYQQEPALIDPRLSIDLKRPDFAGKQLHHRTSYSEIPAGSRAAYLFWLARGGADPRVHITYVMLYFHGLERRVLYDHQRGGVKNTELDSIGQEVERLMAIYDDSHFQLYGSRLLDICLFLRRSFPIDNIVPPSRRPGWEQPLKVRLALAKLASEKRPLPPEWALSWLLTSPEVYLRTPAWRCAEEFQELFSFRYRERFGEGVELKPDREKFVVEYLPANPSFGNNVKMMATLPDFSSAAADLGTLRDLAQDCTNELDAYSRWVGRTGDTDSPPAVALLPAVLAAGRGDAASQALAAWLEQQLAGASLALIETADLLRRWRSKMPGAPARRELKTLSDFLASCALGIEPDAALGGVSLTRQRSAVLFRLPERRRPQPSPAFERATALLQLAAMVAAADGEVKGDEVRHLLQHVEGALDLPPADRLRLEARFRSLAADPPTLAKAKKSLEGIAVEKRRPFGPFLVSLAGTDGHLHPNEVKLLGKLYPLLGLEAQAVYSDIHQLRSGAADEPVAMRRAEMPQGFAIPPAPREAPARTVALDLHKVRARLVETERVSHLLSQIFVEEEETPSAPRPAPPTDGFTVAGLDSGHSALLLMLAGADSWRRLQVEKMAAALGLLPDGALETINEAAFAACGAILLEGDEILEINRDVLGEMLP